MEAISQKDKSWTNVPSKNCPLNASGDCSQNAHCHSVCLLIIGSKQQWSKCGFCLETFSRDASRRPLVTFQYSCLYYYDLFTAISSPTRKTSAILTQWPCPMTPRTAGCPVSTTITVCSCGMYVIFVKWERFTQLSTIRPAYGVWRWEKGHTF